MTTRYEVEYFDGDQRRRTALVDVLLAAGEPSDTVVRGMLAYKINLAPRRRAERCERIINYKRVTSGGGAS